MGFYKELLWKKGYTLLPSLSAGPAHVIISKTFFLFSDLLKAKGTTGETGAQGKIGPKGDKGFPGFNGTKGRRGEDGNQGLPGADLPGPPGPIGEEGKLKTSIVIYYLGSFL